MPAAARSIITGDDAQLQNTFLNLGLNAAQAMPDGGSISFHTDNVSLSAAECAASTFDLEPGNYLRIQVRDTGCGIRPEDIPLLTHQGFTGYNGHIDRQATGLGLYLAGRVCSRLGIALAFDSLWGEGTTVKLTFAEHLQPM